MSKKCLIVEDALYIREIYKYVLQGTEFDIIAEAGDGAEALNKMILHQPDIVILDLILPIKSGIDVLKEFHSLSPASRFLVISSLNTEEVIEKTKSLGAFEYLTKPFTKEQLLASLRSISTHFSEVQNG